MPGLGFGNLRIGLLVAGALLLVALPSASQAYTPEQQQACTPDAFRLCNSDIPDVDRVTACMVRNKSQLSPGCRAFFRSDPEPVAAAGRPMSIRPAARKPVAAKPASAKSKPKSKPKPKPPAKPAAT